MKSILTGDRFVLEQGALRAELLTPWSSAYGRSRFAHSGFISGLWLSDVCFTQAEAGQSTQKSTGGIGLCSEYKCPDVEMDSAVGEEYLKIGVGVMTRTSDPWHLTDETLIEGLPTQLTACADAAVFECVSPCVNGYAYREKRTVLLKEGAIRQEIELENTGSKVIRAPEYCHNFVSLGDLSIDDTHRLELPIIRNKAALRSGELIGTEYGATWTGPNQHFSFVCDDEMNAAEPYAWKLSSSRTGASIAEVIDFHPGRVVLWGTSYCACAEVYNPVCVEPGHTARWSREWRLT